MVKKGREERTVCSALKSGANSRRSGQYSVKPGGKPGTQAECESRPLCGPWAASRARAVSACKGGVRAGARCVGARPSQPRGGLGHPATALSTCGWAREGSATGPRPPAHDHEAVGGGCLLRVDMRTETKRKQVSGVVRDALAGHAATSESKGEPRPAAGVGATDRCRRRSLCPGGRGLWGVAG